MGTNVYVIYREPSEFMQYDEVEKLAKNHDFEGIRKWIERQTDNISTNTIHIGKRSGGWKFLFNHNNWKYYDHTRESIDAFLRGCAKIEDEYGTTLTVDEFWHDFVDAMANGMDGKDYCEFEIKRAKEKESGELEDKYNIFMTLPQALKYAADAKRHNYYEEKNDKDGNPLPSDLTFRFSSSIDFC